jgi:predicted negative regulator of RcsB-dependent stress response
MSEHIKEKEVLQEDHKKSVEVLESPEVLQDRLNSSMEYVKENKNKLSYIVGAIALIVGGFFFFRYYQSTQNADAQKAMFQAVYYFEADSLNKALNGDGKNPGLKEIADDFSGTQAGNLAHFYVGATYLKQGKFDEAITYLSGFSSSDLVVQGRAYCLIGDANMEKNNLDEALSYYEKAANYNPNKEFTPRYLMKVAVAADLKKDNSKAIAAYDKIINEYPLAQEINDAKKYKALLEGVK